MAGASGVMAACCSVAEMALPGSSSKATLSHPETSGPAMSLPAGWGGPPPKFWGSAATACETKMAAAHKSKRTNIGASRGTIAGCFAIIILLTGKSPCEAQSEAQVAGSYEQDRQAASQLFHRGKI